jgi:hypothetical protein
MRGHERTALASDLILATAGGRQAGVDRGYLKNWPSAKHGRVQQSPE